MSLDWQYATRRDVTILTLTGHLGGEAAVLDAAFRLGTQEQPLALCGVRDLPTAVLTATEAIPLSMCPDLDTALDTLAPQG
ncbi:hypothetical protein [Streptomyces noursei]|uniref:hypothetical protein n=1 Tax=Streptomyces noursei TaxID=1971 RepID=UPI0019625C9E|nr:hypothetical protein [Streptomyces noursei]QRX90285.1 hypothetical protein JNO44_04885 [Streptomyces noursei]